MESEESNVFYGQKYISLGISKFFSVPIWPVFGFVVLVPIDNVMEVFGVDFNVCIRI